LNDQVQEDEMGRPCSTNGENRKAYTSLVGNPEENRPLGKPKRKWVNNNTMELGEIIWVGVDCSDVAQNGH
jgi:hypothetical protein